MGGKPVIPVGLVRNSDHPVVRGTFERLAKASTGVANIHRMIANSPDIFGHFIDYAHALRHKSDLDPAERELAIIRVLALNGGDYELVHHRRMGLAAGLTDAEIAGAEAVDIDPTPYGERRFCVLCFADAFARGVELAPPAADRFAGFYDDRQRVELALTLALYLGLARVTGLFVLPED